VCVAHQAVPPDAPPDELDTLAQAAAVEEALRALGHAPSRLALTLDLAPALAALRADPPDPVLNLVESLGGVGPALTCAPALFDALALPYTGCGAEALRVTGDKLLARARLRAADLPVPAAWGEGGEGGEGARWIVKSVDEHGSLGLDESCVVPSGGVEARARDLRARYGGRWLAERYIHGREFNVSLLEAEPRSGGARGEERRCEVLPLAELVFLHDDPRAPRVLSYGGKWDEGAPDYALSERRFPAADTPEEARLHQALRDLCARCWALFGLRGAARVDLRVDEEGRPWLLEVNANPCLAPDAGFMAAAARAGLSVEGVVGRLARCALGAPVPPAVDLGAVSWRRAVEARDEHAVAALVRACGNFSDEEVEIAAELPRERHQRGAASGYELLMAEVGGELLSYACWGRIPGSQTSYDLYWIAAHPRAQGSGLAREVLRRALAEVRAEGGRAVYIETSALPAYAAARGFYVSVGARLAATFEDFYAEGDHKLVYVLDV